MQVFQSQFISVSQPPDQKSYRNEQIGNFCPISKSIGISEYS